MEILKAMTKITRTDTESERVRVSDPFRFQRDICRALTCERDDSIKYLFKSTNTYLLRRLVEKDHLLCFPVLFSSNIPEFPVSVAVRACCKEWMDQPIFAFLVKDWTSRGVEHLMGGNMQPNLIDTVVVRRYILLGLCGLVHVDDLVILELYSSVSEEMADSYMRCLEASIYKDDQPKPFNGLRYSLFV
jgi:hypothetical protein